MAAKAKKAAKPKKKAGPSADNAAFIKLAGAAARVSEAETGVPASVTIAQAIQESGWGKQHMGNANNYFGIKAQTKGGKIVFGDIATGYVDKPTKEFDKKTGKYVTVIAHFRSYKDMAGSFTDHGMFLKDNAIYKKAFAAYAKTKDADQFAGGLTRYATDPDYVSELISLMQKNDLYKYNA